MVHRAGDGTDATAVGTTLRGGELATPVAVLRDTALTHNVDVMQEFCTRVGVALAPHAKTAMSPELMSRQRAAGAWGMTAATPVQVRQLWAFGATRILLANEVVDVRAFSALLRDVGGHPERSLLTYVDSEAVVRLAEEAAAATGVRPHVLVELGHTGGRTGVRGVSSALALAARVAASESLVLAGVAGYEGTVAADRSGVAAVDAYLAELHELAVAIDAENLFPAGTSPVVTAGGSLWFDRVADVLADLPARRMTVVLRSGCYLVHDHGLYAAQGPTTAASWSLPEFRPALEVWSRVLSRPEPGLVLLDAGRRDVSFDQGLPTPLTAWSHDGHAVEVDGAVVTALADQHAFVRVPSDSGLAVGDLVVLGISHPCTTLDRWRTVLLVDDDDQVLGSVRCQVRAGSASLSP